LTDDTAMEQAQQDAINVCHAAILYKGQDAHKLRLVRHDDRPHWRPETWDDPLEYFHLKNQILLATNVGALVLHGGKNLYDLHDDQHTDGCRVLGELHVWEFVEWALKRNDHELHPVYIQEVARRHKTQIYAKANEKDIFSILIRKGQLDLEQRLDAGEPRKDAITYIKEFLEREAPGITQKNSKGDSLAVLVLAINFTSDRTRRDVMNYVDKKKK